jgi:hypothetical protein
MRYPKIPGQNVTPRRAWNIVELAALYGVSKGFVQQRIREGAIRTRHIGRRLIVLDDDARAFFEQPKEAKAAPAPDNGGTRPTAA